MTFQFFFFPLAEMLERCFKVQRPDSITKFWSPRNEEDEKLGQGGQACHCVSQSLLAHGATPCLPVHLHVGTICTSSVTAIAPSTVYTLTLHRLSGVTLCFSSFTYQLMLLVILLGHCSLFICPIKSSRRYVAEIFVLVQYGFAEWQKVYLKNVKRCVLQIHGRSRSQSLKPCRASTNMTAARRTLLILELGDSSA